MLRLQRKQATEAVASRLVRPLLAKPDKVPVILTLIRKELLTNLLTLRLAVAVGFTVVLSVLTTFIGSLNYSQNLQAYHKESREVAEALDKATIYSQVEPRVVLPPEPLGILCRGLWGPIGQAIYVNAELLTCA